MYWPVHHTVLLLNEGFRDSTRQPHWIVGKEDDDDDNRDVVLDRLENTSL